MNLIGKIFTVVILVFSLVFMAMAVAVYATHKNWKAEIEAPANSPGKPKGCLKAQLAEKEQERAKKDKELKDAKDAAEREKEALVQAAARLENENKKLEKEVGETKITLDNLKVSESKAVGAAADATNQTTVLRADVEKLKADIRTAQQERDDYFKKMVEATDKMNEAAAELKRARKQNLDLAEQAGKLEAVLLKIGGNRDPAFYEKWPPKVDGVVTSVSGRDLTTISLGSDDGIRPGHFFEVSRIAGGTPTYVGRIEVIRTDANQSVCKVDPNYQKSLVQKDDRVDSKQP